jgi:hypothetical protein
MSDHQTDNLRLGEIKEQLYNLIETLDNYIGEMRAAQAAAQSTYFSFFFMEGEFAYEVWGNFQQRTDNMDKIEYRSGQFYFLDNEEEAMPIVSCKSQVVMAVTLTSPHASPPCSGRRLNSYSLLRRSTPGPPPNLRAHLLHLPTESRKQPSFLTLPSNTIWSVRLGPHTLLASSSRVHVPLDVFPTLALTPFPPLITVVHVFRAILGFRK